MLERIGVSDVKDLFIDAPEGLFGKNFDLPDNKSEQEVISYLSNIAKKNQPANDSAFFPWGRVLPTFYTSNS